MRAFLASEILHLKSKIQLLTEKQFLILLLTFNLLVRAFRIWDPATPYFDEGLFYLRAARGYLEGVTTLNPEHPPLAKLLMAGSIQIFGDNPFGWRLPGILLGTAGILVTYFLAKRISGSKKLAALSAIFLTFEFGWFVASRVAIPEIYLASFLLIGSFFIFKLFQSGRLINVVWSGLFLGAALASKWSAVLLITWLVLFLIIFWREKLIVKAFSLFSMLIIIIGIYLGAYLPYLTTHQPTQLITLHQWMYDFHSKAVPAFQKKMLSSQGSSHLTFLPWAWLFDPTFPLFGKNFGKEWVETILFFYNPVVLWGGVISAFILTKEQFKKIDPRIVFLLGCFFFLYLPWFLSPRYTIIYYLLAAMPFLAILFALGLQKLWRRSRTWVWALVGLVALSFIIYYPLLSALKTPYLYSRIVSGIVEFVNLKAN